MNVKLLTIICKDILLSGRMKVSVGEKDMYRVADSRCDRSHKGVRYCTEVL